MVDSLDSDTLTAQENNDVLDLNLESTDSVQVQTSQPMVDEDNGAPITDLSIGDMETDLPEPELTESRAVAVAEPVPDEMEIPWGDMQLPSTESGEAGEITHLQSESGHALVEEALAEPVEPAKPKEPIKHAWYVVHCYSGYENKVKKGLEQRINTMGMQEYIFRVVVPIEKEVEIKEGQRRNIERRVFPGYILVEMAELKEGDPETDQAWYVVRNTPGVTGFVSSGDKPVPLRQDEVDKILKRMETDEPKVHVTFKSGQTVHIIDGPFADFRGQVDNVDMTKGKVRVLVSFFGRETPVELDLLQVEKV